MIFLSFVALLFQEDRMLQRKPIVAYPLKDMPMDEHRKDYERQTKLVFPVTEKLVSDPEIIQVRFEVVRDYERGYILGILNRKISDDLLTKYLNRALKAQTRKNIAALVQAKFESDRRGGNNRVEVDFTRFDMNRVHDPKNLDWIIVRLYSYRLTPQAASANLQKLVLPLSYKIVEIRPNDPLAWDVATRGLYATADWPPKKS
jgi:hypothetical protein